MQSIHEVRILADTSAILGVLLLRCALTGLQPARVIALVAVLAEPHAVRTYSSSGGLAGGVSTLLLSLHVSRSMRTGVNENSEESIVAKTKDAILIAPASIHWEIGNAVSSLIMRKKLPDRKALQLIEEFQKIPIRYLGADLKETVAVIDKHGIYA